MKKEKHDILIAQHVNTPPLNPLQNLYSGVKLRILKPYEG